ncbi:ABC transporter ATP-binding protein [Azospira restricta]|uniref:ABC transporter ATP-binding protein n=1 Tax=Azospira restricta TaxID=404405 RepID=A0A974PY31_9RHOO|nr:ABC transporter ATP-binding protein [Azospira restricta]QRJ63613.1 ABC transporter ATP-binding protein [Azospira restricta]
MTAAIVVDGLAKVYRKSWSREAVHALRGISLTVEPGEAFGFVGPNGAGKSTTIKIIMGLLRPTDGHVLIFGESAVLPCARRGVGYVPESPYLQDCLTPMEILEMGLALHRVEVGDRRAHCMEWLDRMALGHVATKALRTFSKGMVQRVALAQALCIKPRLLVLDEPLSGLDPIGRRAVVDTLAEYKRGGGTLFFSSHVLHDVERLADRFGLVHEGRLRAVRSPAELTGEEDLVLVRTFGEIPVAGMREDFPGRWIGEVCSAELWEHLARLRESGHALIEVRQTLSLESAFLKAVERQ